jgi:hypothetical protein
LAVLRAESLSAVIFAWPPCSNQLATCRAASAVGVDVGVAVAVVAEAGGLGGALVAVVLP